MDKHTQDRMQETFSGRIGVARRDITPPQGIYARNWGAGKSDVATGIHHPLTLTCLTFQSDEEASPLVLIGADLGWWKQAADEQKFRNGILQTTGLPEANLMICLSHTHAGPSLSTADAEKPGGELIEPFLAFLQQAAIASIQEALHAAAPGLLDWRYGVCDLATNRDLPMPDEQRVVVGYNPEKEADNTLLVGRIADAKGTINAIIVNYACHPTTLAWDNPLLSPDYIGAMRALVEEKTGGNVLFMQGASGELAPAEQYVGNAGVADAHGRRLGYAVLATLEGMPCPTSALRFSHVVESGAPLAVWKQTPSEPCQGLRATQINVALQLNELPALAVIESEWATCEDRVKKERLWRKMNIRKAFGEQTVFPMGLWIWKIGHAILVGQPNEAYSWYQQAIRKAYPHTPIAVSNIVNGYAGYLPPRDLYDQDMYAVWQSPFEAGSLELLIQETQTGIDQINPKN